jgi:hypothetical protein
MLLSSTICAAYNVLGTLSLSKAACMQGYVQKETHATQVWCPGQCGLQCVGGRLGADYWQQCHPVDNGRLYVLMVIISKVCCNNLYCDNLLP